MGQLDVIRRADLATRPFLGRRVATTGAVWRLRAVDTRTIEPVVD
jgi:hypothetical protein